MKNQTCSCACCGKDLSRELVNATARRYQQEMNELLAQPNPDRARVAFLTLLIAVLDRRSQMMKEKAS